MSTGFPGVIVISSGTVESRTGGEAVTLTTTFFRCTVNGLF